MAAELDPESQTLGVRNLKEVKNFIWDAFTKWHPLGVELELNPVALQATRTKFSDDPAMCFDQMLQDWLLGQGLQPTWRNLASALRAQPINIPALASAIEKKYLNKYQAPQAQPKEKDFAPPTTQLLTEKHHREICDLLRELNPNDCRIVGGALGLYYFTLKKISDDKLPDDMVGEWFKGDDNVLRAAADGGDSRTWDGLIDALKKQHHGGVAKKVEEHIKRKAN